MDKTEIIKIVEKELLRFFDAKTLLKHNKEIMVFSIEETLKAINYSCCCKSDSDLLPSKEEVNIIAKQKAVKYAFTNEYSYWKYVEAIEEGFNLAKSKLNKTK